MGMSCPTRVSVTGELRFNTPAPEKRVDEYTGAVQQEMNTLIQELTSEMSANKLRQLKDICQAQEILESRKRQFIPELTVKRFQDLRDHLADRKALEEIMSSHTCDQQIIVKPCNEGEEPHQCSCFLGNF